MCVYTQEGDEKKAVGNHAGVCALRGFLSLTILSSHPHLDPDAHPPTRTCTHTRTYTYARIGRRLDLRAVALRDGHILQVRGGEALLQGIDMYTTILDERVEV